MEEEGYMTAEFRWRNHNGYEYRIVEYDAECWEIRYYEEGTEKAKVCLPFNDINADGLITVMRKAVDFRREQNGG